MIAFTPQNKLKMLVGFYMITTKVDNVYDVSMPGDVRELLQQKVESRLTAREVLMHHWLPSYSI